MNCLIVNDDPLSIFALTKIIESGFPEWNILQAETIQEAIHCLEEQQIFLVLLDLQFGEESGLGVLQYMHQANLFRRSQCLVVSSVADAGTIAQCHKLGACGYLLKKDVCKSIFSVLRKVASDMDKCHPQHHLNTGAALNDPVKLTHRQRDIIDLLLNGYSNKMIAHALDLSYGTVKNYMFDLMRIMSVNSRLEMAMKLQRNGYMPRKIEQIDRQPMPVPIISRAERAVRVGALQRQVSDSWQ